jgi:glycosyltransferase involved in cell wall biosynthesis
MKILFAIAEQYPTHRADVSVLFGKYLPRHGVHSDILTLHVPNKIPPSWPAGRLLTKRGATSRLTKHIKVLVNDMRILWLARRGYDAVQVRDKALCAVLGLIAARIAGIKFYYWMSFPMAEAWSVFARERGLSVGALRWLSAWLRGQSMAFLLYKVVLPRADHVFVQSDRMREELVGKGVPFDRMTPVPMGFDAENGSMASKQQEGESAERSLTFVYLGTLNRVRSPEIMIEAIDIVRKKVPAAKLLLIGEADEKVDRDYLRQLISDKGLQDHVSITGWLPVDQGWSKAAGCLAGLSPIPRNELFDWGSPTKAIEYFALGLPVIANDQPDQAIVLAGASAICTELSADGFAAAMLDVIANPALFRSQGMTGKEWVYRHRTYEFIAETVFRTYRETLGQVSGKPT